MNDRRRLNFAKTLFLSVQPTFVCINFSFIDTKRNVSRNQRAARYVCEHSLRTSAYGKRNRFKRLRWHFVNELNWEVCSHEFFLAVSIFFTYVMNILDQQFIRTSIYCWKVREFSSFSHMLNYTRIWIDWKVRINWVVQYVRQFNRVAWTDFNDSQMLFSLWIRRKYYFKHDHKYITDI